MELNYPDPAQDPGREARIAAARAALIARHDAQCRQSAAEAHVRRAQEVAADIARAEMEAGQAFRTNDHDD